MRMDPSPCIARHVEDDRGSVQPFEWCPIRAEPGARPWRDDRRENSISYGSAGDDRRRDRHSLASAMIDVVAMNKTEEKNIQRGRL